MTTILSRQLILFFISTLCFSFNVLFPNGVYSNYVALLSMIIAFIICINFCKKFQLLTFSLPLAVIFSLSYYSFVLLLLPFSGIEFNNHIVSNLIIYSNAFFFFIFSQNYFRRSNEISLVPLSTFWFPATGSIFLIFIILLVSFRHPGGELSWVMYGDARNHLNYALKIIESNGITYEILSKYPVLSFALVSLISSSYDRSNFKTGDLLALDLHNFMIMWLIGFVITSYIFGRLLFEYKHYLQLNKFFIWSLSSILSLIPISGFFMSLSISEGFTSATWGFLLMVCLFYVNIFAKVNSALVQKFVLIVTNLLVIILSILVWTPLLFIVAPVTLYILLKYLKTISTNYLYVFFLMLLISTSLYLFLAPLSGSQGYVGLDGAGNFPRHTLAILLLFLLSFLSLFYTYLTKSAKLNLNYSLLLMPFLPIPTLVLAILYVMSKRQPDQSKWSYYSLKLLWQYDMLMIFFIIVFIIAILNKAKLFENGNSKKMSYALMACSILLVPFLLYQVSPMSNSIRLISQGWNFPNSTIVKDVLLIGNSLKNQEVLFWKYSDHPNNDRLGNFWLNLYDKGSKPNSFTGWAYYSNHVDSTFLCDLLENQPNRKIITSRKSETLQDLATCKIKIPDITKVFFNM